MKSSSALEEFLELCEQAHPENGHLVSAHGSSVVESYSVVESSSIYDQAVCSTSPSESLRKRSQAEIEDSASLSNREGNAVIRSFESYQSPLAHSTPRPCDKKSGFWIDPGEISEHLRQDTVAIAMKYLFK